MVPLPAIFIFMHMTNFQKAWFSRFQEIFYFKSLLLFIKIRTSITSLSTFKRTFLDIEKLHLYINHFDNVCKVNLKKNCSFSG